MSKPKREPMPQLLTLPDAKTEARICRAIAEYQGTGTTLESALGALVLGQHYGSRALRMVHSPSTYRKYERVLGIKFEDLCPEYTPLSSRNVGLRVAERLGAFWDVVMGRKKTDKKGWFNENGGERGDE